MQPHFLTLSAIFFSCLSNVGRQGPGRTIIYLQHIPNGRSCMDKYRVIHEILHGLGLHHEHNRPDRDRFIKIHMDNLLSEYFKLRCRDCILQLSLNYHLLG